MKKILIAEDDRPLRHALQKMLEAAGFSVESAKDGIEALARLKQKKFDIVLLDVGLTKVNGLEVLEHIYAKATRQKVVVMTDDDTPGTVLRAVRKQAYHYVRKPVPAKTLVDVVTKALRASAEVPPIEVLSAQPHWVELLVPCQLEAAERIQSFLMGLKADLPRDLRESVGLAFHELLTNAIEWGGKLDPNRKVRIAYLRGRRMLLYRIADPGAGFNPEGLAHAAVSNPSSEPYGHIRVREEKGLRAGGFGLLLVRQIVDELLYNEARNEVVFVKYTD